MKKRDDIGNWLICEDCGEPVLAELTHNGVMPCLHYVHCGWGHGPFNPDDGWADAKSALVENRALRNPNINLLNRAEAAEARLADKK